MTFDMQRARDLCDKLSVGGGQTVSANIAYYKAHYQAAKMLPAALDRIEELEAALIGERTLVLKLQHYPNIAIKQLKAEGKLDASRVDIREVGNYEGDLNRAAHELEEEVCEHDWTNMAPNNHMTCSRCGKIKW